MVGRLGDSGVDAFAIIRIVAIAESQFRSGTFIPPPKRWIGRSSGFRFPAEMPDVQDIEDELNDFALDSIRYTQRSGLCRSLKGL